MKEKLPHLASHMRRSETTYDIGHLAKVALAIYFLKHSDR